MSKDVLGKALLDFQHGDFFENIKTVMTLYNGLGEEKDILPLPYLFRTFNEMPQLEKDALNLCSGSVLDIGCGAGSHSLYLQKIGLHVTALDESPGAVRTCELRGIKNCIQSKITEFSGRSFDTLLLLMNGVGVAGTVEGLNKLLAHLKTLLKPKGQIILDSSDIIYMFDSDEDGGYWIPFDDKYYGEVKFQIKYKKLSSKYFNWLYMDYDTLKNIAQNYNLDCEIVSQGEHYDYLARITPK